MNVFKTPTPDMAMQPEMQQSQAPTMYPGMAAPYRPTGNVKVAQSFDEAQSNLRAGCCGDSGARSIEHVTRPRYGRKA